MHHMAISRLPQPLQAILHDYDREPPSRVLDDSTLNTDEYCRYHRARIKRLRARGAGDDFETDRDYIAEAN